MPKPVVASRIVVDIEEPRCNHPYIVSAGRNVRTTVKATRLKHQPVNQVLTSVDEIPGERIIYDAEADKVTIEDRLGYAEYIPLRRELERLSKSVFGVIDPSAYGHPVPSETYHLHNDNDRASWLMELIKLSEGKAIRVVEGKIPSREEVNELGEWTKAPFSGFQNPDVYRHRRKKTPTADKQ